MEDTWRETLVEWFDWAYEGYWGKDPREIVRETHTDICTAIRQLDRQIAKAQQEEKKLLSDVTKTSKAARSDADLIPISRSVARARRGIARSEKLKFDLVGFGQDLLETSVNTDMAETMLRVTNALAQVQAVTGGANALSHVVNKYERQKDVMEAMRGKVEEMNADAGEDADALETLNKLKDELNLNLQYELPDASRRAAARPAATEVGGGGIDGDMLIRLDKLNGRGQ